MGWKAVERRVLTWFGTDRLGPVGEHGPDGLTDTLSIEIKDRKSLPKWFLSAYNESLKLLENGYQVPVTRLTLTETGQHFALVELDFLLSVLDKASLARPRKEGIPDATRLTGLATTTMEWPRLPVWMANGLQQAIDGAEDHRLPIVVFHQKRKHSYQALMPLEHFIFLIEVGGIRCPELKAPHSRSPTQPLSRQSTKPKPSQKANLVGSSVTTAT
jgi:hypothetical protein